jgi:hypothetical protein
MSVNRFKKVQRELAIQRRIEELLIDHRGFSKRKLYAMAKQWVKHHYGSKATREGSY